MEKYPSPVNLHLAAKRFIFAPKLNMEALNILSDQHLKRDQRLSKIQNQMGAALTAIGTTLTTLLQEQGQGGGASFPY